MQTLCLKQAAQTEELAYFQLCNVVLLSSATLAFFNVLTVRSEESETGIQVFDHNGNPVGMSKAAGEKVF